MGWWVSLAGNDGAVRVERHREGGTYRVGGTIDPELSVTYNYSDHFEEALHPLGLEYLDRKKAGDVVPRLRKAVDALGTDQSDNYWESTKGNAGHALSILLSWAEQYPAAEFRVL